MSFPNVDAWLTSSPDDGVDTRDREYYEGPICGTCGGPHSEATRRGCPEDGDGRLGYGEARAERRREHEWDRGFHSEDPEEVTF